MARKPAARGRIPKKIAEALHIPEDLEIVKKKPSGWQQGNSFWKARASHGRHKLFESPEILWEACQEYFQWVEDNPLPEAKAFAYEGDVTIETIPKLRVMTIGSLTLFLDISETTWWEYVKRPDFAEITERVGKAIREQKFSGAAAGFFNANIIARDLGLVEKKELTGADGGPIRTENRTITTEMTPQEAAEAFADTLREDG